MPKLKQAKQRLAKKVQASEGTKARQRPRKVETKHSGAQGGARSLAVRSESVNTRVRGKGTEPRQRLKKVAIVMGSQSDYETLGHAEQIMIDFSIDYEIQVISAHRTPSLMYQFAQEAIKKGIKVIIAGAGGSAHLPGMISALTTLPVLAVPVESKSLKGLDSLLSIVQMPAGVPTATFAIGTSGAINAGLFALQILSLHDKALAKKISAYRAKNSGKALAGNEIVQRRIKEKKK